MSISDGNYFPMPYIRDSPTSSLRSIYFFVQCTVHLLWYKSNIAEFVQSRLSFENIFLEIFLTLQSAFYFATELQMGELVRTARSLYTLAYFLLLKYNDQCTYSRSASKIKYVDVTWRRPEPRCWCKHFVESKKKKKKFLDSVGLGSFHKNSSGMPEIN